MPTPQPWSPALTANYRFADSQKDVRFVQLRDGSFWMVWTDSQDTGVGSPAGSDLVGQRYNAFGVPMGGEVRLNNNFFVDNERKADLAADAGSNEFFIVYEDFNADGSVDIILERKNGDGTHISFAAIAADPTNDDTGIDYRNPRVAVASASSGLVVFERTNDAGVTDIVGRLFDPSTGLAIGGIFTIAADQYDFPTPEITATSDGRYAVVWTDVNNFDPVTTEIQGAFVSAAAAVSAFPVTQGFGTGFAPSVAALAGGRIVVTWTGNSTLILGSVFEPTGAILGSPFTVTTGGDTVGDSHVVATGNSITVAWENATLSQVKIVNFTLSGSSMLNSGGPSVAASNQSVSDIALISLGDGRVLLGYDNPLATARIFDPRANANATAVYAPTDQQIGTPGADVFTAAAGADIVHGWDGNDDITDGAGTEAQYFGGEGNDRISFSFVDAAEFADGGNGIDVLKYTALAGPTTVNLAAGTATTGAVTQIVINFEDFDSSGVDASVNVTGGAGANFLRTFTGDDYLDGGAGADEMRGWEGSDVYIVDDFGDVVGDFGVGDTDEVRTSLGDRAGPNPILYFLPTNIENMTGTLGSAQFLQGNVLNNVITTTAGADFLYAHDGGNDSLSSGGGNDFLYFGATFTNDDSVDGGAGTDRLALYGNYMLTFAAGVMNNIERLMLYSEAGTVSNYNLTTVDANVAAGAQLEVAALSLDAGDSLTFNGAAETDGRFWFRAGAGNDVLIGGAGNDRFVGGLGGDRMTGNGGADRFEVAAVAHSTGVNFDTLVGFDTNVDRINITGAPASWATAVSGALSNANFDAELAALVDNNLGANQAIRVNVTSGDHASKNFIVFDANNDGSYTPGADYVFAFEGAVGPIFENAGIFI